MTPALKSVGLLAASATVVAGSLFLTAPTRGATTVAPATPVVASASPNRYLTARLESSHALRGVSETHIAVSVQAPELSKAITRAPLAVAIVLDRSGSMSGAKLAQAKRAASELIERLEEADRFSVTVYGSEVETIVTLRNADPRSVGQAQAKIAAINDRGSTNISGGLAAGRDQLQSAGGGLRRIVLISDGKATHGITGAAELSGLARETAARGITLTTVGVGLDFDEKKMTAMAVAGRGNYYFAENAANLSTLFATELDRVAATAATDVAVVFEPAKGVTVLEAYGHASHSGRVRLADLHAGETRRVVYRVRGRFDANGTSSLGRVRLELTAAEGGERIVEAKTLEVKVTDDHHQVRRGANAEAVAMIERARTAVTLEQATEMFERGESDSARRLLRQRRSAAVQRANEVGAAALGDELGAIADDAEASFAAPAASPKGKRGRKANRAKSYEMLH